LDGENLGARHQVFDHFEQALAVIRSSARVTKPALASTRTHELFDPMPHRADEVQSAHGYDKIRSDVGVGVDFIAPTRTIGLR
jgi:hypothetical protein